jgi:hypothetical protein
MKPNWMPPWIKCYQRTEDVMPLDFPTNVPITFRFAINKQLSYRGIHGEFRSRKARAACVQQKACPI